MRKTKGEIAAQILDFLQAHPDEAFSPHKIAKEIERFSGSVTWTCDAMYKRANWLRRRISPSRTAYRDRLPRPLTSIRGKQFEVRRHCGVGRCGPKSAGQRRLRFRGGLDLI